MEPIVEQASSHSWRGHSSVLEVKRSALRTSETHFEDALQPQSVLCDNMNRRRNRRRTGELNPYWTAGEKEQAQFLNAVEGRIPSSCLAVGDRAQERQFTPPRWNVIPCVSSVAESKLNPTENREVGRLKSKMSTVYRGRWGDARRGLCRRLLTHLGACG